MGHRRCITRKWLDSRVLDKPKMRALESGRLWGCIKIIWSRGGKGFHQGLGLRYQNNGCLLGPLENRINQSVWSQAPRRDQRQPRSLDPRTLGNFQFHLWGPDGSFQEWIKMWVWSLKGGTDAILFGLVSGYINKTWIAPSTKEKRMHFFTCTADSLSVHLNLSQHCWSTVLQYKIKTLKNK